MMFYVLNKIAEVCVSYFQSLRGFLFTQPGASHLRFSVMAFNNHYTVICTYIALGTFSRSIWFSLSSRMSFLGVTTVGRLSVAAVSRRELHFFGIKVSRGCG